MESFAGTIVGGHLGALYLWEPEEKIIYCKDKTLIGKVFPVDEGLAAAYAGTILAEIVKHSNNELEKDLWKWNTLIDSYVPIRSGRVEDILAVADCFSHDRGT